MGIRNDESSRPLCREGTVGGVVCGSKILNNFFSLRTYCALWERECDGGSRGWCKCQTDSPLYAHTAPFGRAVLLGVWGVHFLPRGKKRTKKTRGGYAPQPRAAVGGATVRLANEARLKGLGKCRRSVLFGTASKTALAGGSMPDFGRTRPSHNEKGGVRLQTLLPNGKGFTKISFQTQVGRAKQCPTRAN